MLKSFEDKLYSNIGKKLRTLAVVIGLIGALAFVIGVICLIAALSTGGDGEVVLAIALVVFSVISVVASWPIYAFGQVTDDVHDMRSKP